MHKHIRSYLRSAALIGAAAALTVAGLALAQGGSGSGSPPTDPREQIAIDAGGPPPLGPKQNLTYAEFHVIDNGQAKVVRLDAGKVVSASESSITIGENDGNQVTIPVDGNTQVLAGPGKTLKVSDLQKGQQVNVFHPAGGTAQTILVPPKPGDLPTKGEILRHGGATVRVFKAPGGDRLFNRGGPPPGGVGFAIGGPSPPSGK